MGTHGTRSKNSLLVLTVGMMSVGLLVGDGSAQTPPACQQTKLFMPGGNADDFFGNSVDLDSSFLFVGASQVNRPFDTTSGSVHIFQPGLTPNTWIEVQVLEGPDDKLKDHFGNTLEVNNDLLIVNAHFETGATLESGAAFIFRFEPVSETWLFEDKIFASDGGLMEKSNRVSISGDFAILGTASHEHDNIKSGAAHIFRFDGISWNEEAELLASDRAVADVFGISVALVGNVAIVGANRDDDLGTDSGSVYVFKRVAGIWIQTGKINAPDGVAGDRFGWSVDFDGTTLAIGARKHDYGEPDLGAVYLFQDNTLPGWEFITKLTPPPNGDGLNDNFGTTVDIDTDRIAISTLRNLSSRAVHVFRNSVTGWKHVLRLEAQDSSSELGEGFGSSIAIHNETIAIGAPFDDQQGEADAGAVYTHINLFIPDCDDNCISDTEELDAGTAFDCNANGILDVCDLSDGVTLDCNLNGIPDECEDCDNNGIADECDLNPRYSQGSGSLSPIGLGSDAIFTFVSPPTRLSDVTFDFTASADLAGTFTSIDVFLNSVNIGEVFKSTGTTCADPPNEDQIILTQASFDAIVGSGDADVLMTAFDIDPFACGGANFVTVNMSFFTPLLIDIDTNENGIIDSCDLARGDFNLDGVVNVTDLLSLLASWGVCPAPCPEDTNLDGSVNVTDLLTLLANWG